VCSSDLAPLMATRFEQQNNGNRHSIYEVKSVPRA
jgi:hypothetical protein